MSQPIRVLIVDDSSLIRTILTDLLSSDPGIEVVGTAPDPYVARDKVIALKPDVMTLDVEMPRMDGITFLEKVMEHLPVRTLVISSLTTTGAETAIRALEAGAIDVMAKPALDVQRSMEAIRDELISRVKAVSKAVLAKKAPKRAPAVADAPYRPLLRTTHQVITIASSTGGTEALKVLLQDFPRDAPGTLIVQHISPFFTEAYAQSLQRLLPHEVRVAAEGDRVLPGRILIAPGDRHMELTRSGAYYYVKLHQEKPLHGVRPAADYLMKSAARAAGSNAVGIILTGMGKDGAEGLLEMKNAGARTFAQDEKSCVVYGMPKVAAEIGAVDEVLPLDRIAEGVLRHLRKKEAA